jgi:23S rRNA (uracil1939-C5)-methyltransferase
MALIELEITKFVPPGRGMGVYNQKAVFIAGTAVGDVVTAYIVKEKKDHIIANLHEVLKPSTERVDIPCPYFKKCGACDFMQLKYDNQIQYKQQFLQTLIEANEFSISAKWVGSPQVKNFRYRSHIKCINGQIGYMARNSNLLVPIDHCLILSEKLNAHLEKLSKLAYQKAEFLMLHGKASDQISIYIKQNRETFVLPGKEPDVIENYGYGDIKLSAANFAQSNPVITTAITEAIIKNCQQSDQVCEIYCGSGTFTIAIAKQVGQVWGYELDRSAIQLAKENMNINHLNNVHLNATNADAIKIKPNIDTIIVDPPRAGLSNIVRKKIFKSKAGRLIYISCNPVSMLRDIKALTANHRFILRSITGYDMYCLSSHMEAMAILDAG